MKIQYIHTQTPYIQLLLKLPTLTQNVILCPISVRQHEHIIKIQSINTKLLKNTPFICYNKD